MPPRINRIANEDSRSVFTVTAATGVGFGAVAAGLKLNRGNCLDSDELRHPAEDFCHTHACYQSLHRA